MFHILKKVLFDGDKPWREWICNEELPQAESEATPPVQNVEANFSDEDEPNSEIKRSSPCNHKTNADGAADEDRPFLDSHYHNVKERHAVICSVISISENRCALQIYERRVDVELSAVQIDFLPFPKDKVVVSCYVTFHEDRFGDEIMKYHPVSVMPLGAQKKQRCTVKEVNNHGGKLADNIIFLNDFLVERKVMQVGDIVYADLVQSQSEKCTFLDHISGYRAIRIQLESEFVDEQINATEVVEQIRKPLTERNDDNAQASKKPSQLLTVTPNQTVEKGSTFTRKEVTFIVHNNSSNTVVAHGVEMRGPDRDPTKVGLVDSSLSGDFIIRPRADVSITFFISADAPCPSNMLFVIKFTKFLVTRTIVLIDARGNLDEPAADVAVAQDVRPNVKISQPEGIRSYAHRVWSSRCDPVPAPYMSPPRRFVHERIGQYSVPEELRSKFFLGGNIEAHVPCLTQPLTMANYTQRFDTLLHLEELQFFIAVRAYDMDSAIFRISGAELILNIRNLSDRQPALTLGDKVRVHNLTGDKTLRPYEGRIRKVLQDGVVLKFCDTFHESYLGESYRVEFFSSRSNFRKQHHAIHRAIKNLNAEFLFPTQVQIRHPPHNVRLDPVGRMVINNNVSPWHNNSLNSVQKMAVRNILRGEAVGMPYIVFGPPGTGKTKTLVETVLQVVERIPGAHVMIATPSNSTANLIQSQLMTSTLMNVKSLVRLISHSVVERELVADGMLPYCATIDVAASNTADSTFQLLESGLRLNVSGDTLATYRVVIGTCMMLGNMMQIRLPPKHFTHILFDEAGQTSEPDAMLVVTQCSQKHSQVVLFGDPYQLQDLVINNLANNCGLSMSLLERLLHCSPYQKGAVPLSEDTCGYDCRLITKLLYNYRTHPSILQVFNHLFYDGDVRPTIDPETSCEANAVRALQNLLPVCEAGQRAPTHGTFFYGVQSEPERANDSTSWINSEEAHQIYNFTLSLYKQGVKALNIGIITHYAKQVKLLRNLFTIRKADMPKIGSVEEFLGQERDIILVSTVRSDSLGFVSCPKRMNVAISRGRYLLCVYGNPQLLMSNSYWRRYIQYCVKNNAYSGIPLPENVLANGGDDPLID